MFYVSGVKKYNHIISMLLMVVVILMPFGGRSAVLNSRIDQTVRVVAQSPCQQSKINQSALGDLCQSKTTGGHLYCLLSDFVIFFQTIMGKMNFLFVLGMLAASHHRRLFKPPRFILA